MEMHMIRDNTLIQASHHIIQWLEESKQNVDEFIDDSVEAFCVTDADGVVLRGNKKFAMLFDSDMEKVRGRSLADLFSAERWNFFHNKLSIIQSQKDVMTPAEFELVVDHKGETPALTMLWSVYSFVSGDGRQTKLYAVSGRDLTETRNYEKRYSSIYANMPIGVIEVNSSFTVSDHFSAYAEYLLNHEDLQSRNLWDILFRPSLPFLQENERKGIELLRSIFGKSPSEYESISRELPHRAFVPPGDSSGRWLGLTYAPIFVDGKITNLLIIFDDRTGLE